MKNVITIGLMALCLLYLACGNSTNSDDEATKPLFHVTVVDSAGLAVENIMVGTVNISNHISRPAPPKFATPTTNINFTLPQSGHYDLQIKNYYKQILESFEGDAGAGVHSINWDASSHISGFYYYDLVVTDVSGDVLYTGTKTILLETAPDASQSVWGSTDSTGVFRSLDTLLFPCLLGNPPEIVLYDEFGNVLDTVNDFYTDSVYVTLSDSVNPDKFQYFKKALVPTGNVFQLTWDSTRAY